MPLLAEGYRPENSADCLSLFLAVVMLLSTACSSTGSSRKLRSFEMDSVAVESLGASPELKVRFGIRDDESTVDAGVGIGAGAGAAAGAGTALVCGPFVWLCAMGTVPIGALVGYVAGGVVSESVDDSRTPPLEDLLILDALFNQIARERTLHSEIASALEKSLPVERLAEQSDADTLLQLVLSDIQFRRTTSNEYSLTIGVLLLANWNRGGPSRSFGSQVFRASSGSRPLDEWTHDDGVNLNHAFDQAITQLVSTVREDLKFSAN